MQFDSIIGMQDAKDALRLLAMEPRLKGVLLGAGPGTGKSTLARAFAAAMGGMVEIPAGVTPDRLLGGLDLEQALRGGAPSVEPGLMARADGRVLYVDNAHLLEPWAAQQIAECLNSGRVCVERDGFSAQVATRFLMVATFDPQAGQVHAALRDAIGLHVYEGAAPSVQQRVAVMKGEPQSAGQFRVAKSRSIEMRPEDERRIVSAAVALGIEGHRADSYALLAARASAALRGESWVDEGDVQTAMRLVLYPRAPKPLPEPDRSRAIERDTNPRAEDRELTIVTAAAASVPEELIRVAPVVSHDRGRFVRATREGERIALAATVRAAAPYQRVRAAGSLAIRVTADDLRFQRLRQRASTLIVFALDASGSMAASRLHQVKGAAIHLLQTAYLRRAKVALVSFRGSEAQVLIEPTRSVALAKRAVDALPAGGGTPMAAGLEAALRVATSQRHTSCRAMLVLLTDGRANVPRAGAVQEDLAAVCRSVREREIAAVVIDTAGRFVATGDADRIAQMLSARYFHLPRVDARGIAGAVGEELARMNL